MTSQWPTWRLKSPTLDCLSNCLFKLTSKRTSKPALLTLCERNPWPSQGPETWKTFPWNDVIGTWNTQDRFTPCISTDTLNMLNISTFGGRHNGRDGASNHQPRDCLLNRLSDADQRKHQSSASLAFVWGIHRSPVNSPHKKASNAENVSVWWRYHEPPLHISQKKMMDELWFNRNKEAYY